MRKRLAELSTPPVLVYPNWEALMTPPALFSSTTVTVWTISAPPSNKIKMTTPVAPLCPSDALLSSLNALDSAQLGSRQHRLEHQAPSRLSVGCHFCVFFGLQGARKPRQDRRTRPTSTAVGIILYRVHLHPGISQRQYQGAPIFSPTCLCLRRRSTAVVPAALFRLTKNASSSARTAYLLVDLPPCVSVWLGWSPLIRALAWMGSRSPLVIFKIFANKGLE